jgi:phenylpropionate dioxygenase-like ring-hydroxylating dioxygenase large terminal subunit
LKERVAADLRDLVQDDRIHRDLYVSPRIFALEQERLFARTWQYLGHDSQIPSPGDYYSTQVAGRPLLMVRHDDGSVRALMNRCAHKGARVVSAASGNTGRFFRCPYHAWAYNTDGSIRAIPLRSGYDATALHQCEAAQGLTRVTSAVHRGFVFVRLSEAGPAFDAYFGPVLGAIDNLADRSPEGELELAGACLRSVMRCNWKMYLENVNDTMHPVTTHQSAADAAQAVWDRQPPGTPKPMSMEQMLPFGSGYDFFEKMGGRLFANGHSILGTQASIHTGYGALMSDYAESLERAHGPERAREVLAFAPQNTILFPSVAVKSSPQTLRVIRPLAADRTLIEIWALRPRGAPQVLQQRTAMYNRLVFSPMSVVAHDDVHVFETMQRSLIAPGNKWVSLQRDWHGGEEIAPADVGGTNERLMRNQYRAWAAFMAMQ